MLQRCRPSWKNLATLVLVAACGLSAGQLAGAASATAQDEATRTDPTTLPVLQADDTDAIKQHIGEEVIVTGKISKAAWSRSGKVMNIEFEGNGAEDFAAALFERNRERFDKAFNGDLEKSLVGATVRFKGELQEYGGNADRYAGRPEMILNAPTQITILEEASE